MDALRKLIYRAQGGAQALDDKLIRRNFSNHVPYLLRFRRAARQLPPLDPPPFNDKKEVLAKKRKNRYLKRRTYWTKERAYGKLPQFENRRDVESMKNKSKSHPYKASANDLEEVDRILRRANRIMHSPEVAAQMDLTILERVGLRLFFLRKDQGMSLDDLATLSGVEEELLRDIEDGLASLSDLQRVIHNIAQALGVDICTFSKYVGSYLPDK